MKPEEIMETIESISNMKGIPKENVISSYEEAILAAARKKFGSNKIFEVEFNTTTYEMDIYQFMEVVENVENHSTEILFNEARKFDPECEIGDEIGIKIDVEKLGRISAHLAKNFANKRLSFQERNRIYKSFAGRVGELITGTIRRIESTSVIVDLGSIEGAIPRRLQTYNDKYKIGKKIQAYVAEVNENSNYYQVILSRTHKEFIIKLFEQEVNELKLGTIEIKNIARNPGFRTKIAVISNGNTDAVKAMIGFSGFKIKAVKREIFGERIDIIQYDEDIAKFACNALSPVAVDKVLLDTNNKKMDITVPDDQLILATGKNGHNTKLTSKLIGWNLNILSSSQDKIEREKCLNEMKSFDFLNEMKINTLYNFGIKNKKDIDNVDIEFISSIPTIGIEIAKKLKGY